MFLNFVIGDHTTPEKSKLQSIYEKFHNIIKRSSTSGEHSNRDKMSVADETFEIPLPPTGDLMAMSPKKSENKENYQDPENDLLTGHRFDSSCDVTMLEIPNTDDVFIDATNLDYLVKCAESNCNMNLIDRGKESLFVKFDPLCSKQKLEPIIMQHSQSWTSSNDCDVGYETGSAASINDNLVSTPKRSVSTDSMAFCLTKDKPTQRVLPAVKQDVSELNVLASKPTPVLVRSVSAIMTPTRVAMDRLISISGQTPPIRTPQQHRDQFNTHQLDHLHSLRNIIQKQDQEVMQLRQENQELRSALQSTEHKLIRCEEDMVAKVKKLTDEKNSLIEKEMRLVQQINEKNVGNKQMSIVMEEYEKTISSLIGDQQSDKITTKKIIDKLTEDRDEAVNHLSNMEASFNDLLSKYEKCKSVNLESKEREKLLTEKIEKLEAAMQKYDSLYCDLKEGTSVSLTEANETLENLKKSHCSEIAKLNATIKKCELTVSSLQESLTQKTRENAELTRICDQLISDVQ